MASSNTPAAPALPLGIDGRDVAVVVTPVVAGSAVGIAIAGSIRGWYRTLDKPAWTPPDGVFGPVWTVLYLLMGIAAALVAREGRRGPASRPRAGQQAVDASLGAFAVQLVLNLAWSLVFFRARRLRLAALEIVALWAAIVVTTVGVRARAARLRPAPAPVPRLDDLRRRAQHRDRPAQPPRLTGPGRHRRAPYTRTVDSLDDRPAGLDLAALAAPNMSPILGRYMDRSWSHGDGHRLYDTAGRELPRLRERDRRHGARPRAPPGDRRRPRAGRQADGPGPRDRLLRADGRASRRCSPTRSRRRSTRSCSSTRAPRRSTARSSSPAGSPGGPGSSRSAARSTGGRSAPPA